MCDLRPGCKRHFLPPLNCIPSTSPSRPHALNLILALSTAYIPSTSSLSSRAHALTLDRALSTACPRPHPRLLPDRMPSPSSTPSRPHSLTLDRASRSHTLALALYRMPSPSRSRLPSQPHALVFDRASRKHTLVNALSTSCPHPRPHPRPLECMHNDNDTIFGVAHVYP